MATYGTYYFNGPDLASATSVYTDEALTILAADGWYSDGIVTRKQVGGVLGVQLDCPSCGLPCSEVVADSGNVVPVPTGNNYKGTYKTKVDVGAGPDGDNNLGAVIVRVRMANAIGLSGYSSYQVLVDGATTNRSNKFSASDDWNVSTGGGADGGYRGNLGTIPLTNDALPIWMGTSPASNIPQQDYPVACGASTALGLPDNGWAPGSGLPGPVTIPANPIYNWDEGSGYYLDSTLTATMVVEAQQVQLGSGYDVGWLLAVIPKTNYSEVIDVEVVAQKLNCGLSNRDYIKVECPVTLDSTATAGPFATEAEVCAFNGPPWSNYVFNAPGARGVVAGAPAVIYEYGYPNLWDFAFKDSYGETYADAGYYQYVDSAFEGTGEPTVRWFRVDDNGVIVQTQQVCVVEEEIETPICGTTVIPLTQGPGSYKLPFLTDTTVGAVIVRLYVGAITDGVSARHETAGVFNYYSQWVSSGHNPGSQCSGFLSEDNCINGCSQGAGQFNNRGGGANMPILGDTTLRAPSGEPMFLGRVLLEECESGQGFAKYPYVQINQQDNAYLDPVATSYGCDIPNTLGVMGKINLPPNGIHQVSPGSNYGSIAQQATGASQVVSSSSLQVIQSILTPFPSENEVTNPPGTADGDLSYVYPECTYYFYPGFAENDTGLYPQETWSETFQAFQPSGSGEGGYITIKPRQVQLSLTHPSMLMTVIPKTTVDIETIEFTIQSLICNTGFWIHMDCPAALDLVNVTPAQTTVAAANVAAITDTVYIAKPATERQGQTYVIPTANLLYLGSLVFQDVNGVNKAPAGYYGFTNGAAQTVAYVNSYGAVDWMCVNPATDPTCTNVWDPGGLCNP